jgi:hypothetical protein
MGTSGKFIQRQRRDLHAFTQPSSRVLRGLYPRSAGNCILLSKGQYTIRRQGQVRTT